MKPTSIVTLCLVTLVGAGSAVWLNAGEKPKPYPKPTPPPPASPIFNPSAERAQTAEDIDRDLRGHDDRVEREIEKALLSNDEQRLEAAFVFLLPELLQVAPKRVADMVARQEPGRARNTLRTDVTRQWIASDAREAVAWIKSLDEDERRASAITAVSWIAEHDPIAAMKLADELGVRERVTAARE